MSRRGIISIGNNAVVSGGTTNVVPKAGAGGALTNSSITDDGTRVSVSEGIQVAGSSTPVAGAGIEMFYAGTNIGAIQCFDRGGSAWRELDLNALTVGLLPQGGVVSVGNGHTTWLTDNTYDIGASGATRPRSGYFGTSLTAGTSVLTPTITGTTTNVASTIQAGVDANTTGATASLTVRGENVTAGGSNNLAGGDLILAAGIGTGTATPAHVKIQGPALGLSAANTQQPLVTNFVTHKKAGSTTSAQSTSLFNIASATNTAWGLEVLVHVDLISSTPNVCGTTERFSLTGTNNNGAFGTVNIVAGTISTLCSAGTLTLAMNATAANPSVISVTPTWGTITSITSATITVQIQNVSQQEITLL